MNKVAIVQARMGSTRLPGKVLKTLGNRSVLEQVVFQLKASKELKDIVIATSDSCEDNQIEDHCRKNGWNVFRGSLHDVLERYYGAAKAFEVETIVRITADCPLIDPHIVDEVIRLQKKTSSDYTSNINPPTFPDGLDCEVFTFKSLEKARNEATHPQEREHVTPFIRNHTELFSQANYLNDKDLSFHRWTLDREEDYKFLSKVVEILGSEKVISYQDVLKVLEKNLDLLDINRHIIRNEGTHSKD